MPGGCPKAGGMHPPFTRRVRSRVENPWDERWLPEEEQRHRELLGGIRLWDERNSSSDVEEIHYHLSLSVLQ